MLKLIGLQYTSSIRPKLPVTELRTSKKHTGKQTNCENKTTSYGI